MKFPLVVATLVAVVQSAGNSWKSTQWGLGAAHTDTGKLHSAKRRNQDAWVNLSLAAGKIKILGVFDGHGIAGDVIAGMLREETKSQFASPAVQRLLSHSNQLNLRPIIRKLMHSRFLNFQAKAKLLEGSDQSGSTISIAALTTTKKKVVWKDTTCTQQILEIAK
eukprot:GHVP01014130.1.p1 GENE.GHVP01014130.1~~GHVP01014130.1.p1  ORF type:complete len:165 (-),score=23.23 GHVP01014130.1:511-1005(-)